MADGGTWVKADFEDWTFAETKGVVQSGPFKGMRMLRELTWSDGMLTPMLLGCHERELHDPLVKEIARLEAMERPVIANVGCAEGYYAIGLKLRLPHAQVWAVDIEANALRIAAEAARLNQVELVMADDPRVVLELPPDLIVMDCEGEEVKFLNPYTFPALRRSHIIVEIHQSKEQKTGEILAEHWHQSHNIICYIESWRNPNEFEFLRKETSMVRWLAVCENRPARMAWFYMTPKVEDEVSAADS